MAVETEVIGVRFRPNGKIYYFSPRGLETPLGENVIVLTSQGTEYGRVVLGKRTISDGTRIENLRPIIRVATEEDTRQHRENQEKSAAAYDLCLEKIKEHDLKMKLIAAEYAFDGSKLLFYFTADGRVDFRNLVRDLASVFHIRIELRQIGVRDEARIKGGIGICGRELCCHTFLSEFVPVSIKMAKEQSLSLNPSKISGVCGRLMCCLKNEQETYEYLNSRLPHVGDTVTASDGTEGIVSYINVLRQSVRVVVTDEDGNREVREFKAEDLTFQPSRRRKFVKGDNGNEAEPRRQRREKQPVSGHRDRESGHHDRESGKEENRGGKTRRTQESGERQKNNGRNRDRNTRHKTGGKD